MQRHRYLIIQESEPRLRKSLRMFLYFVMFLLATFYFFGFFYWGTEPLDSETRIEGR